MKVLMLGWEFPPLKSGGLGTYLFHFTRELNALGNQISFILPRTGKKIHHDFIDILQAEPQAEFFEVNSRLAPYITMSDGTCLLQREQFGLLDEVQSYTQNAFCIGKEIECEVIHCHDWMTFPAGIQLKKALGKPLVLTVHSTEFDRTGQLYPNENIAEIEKAGLTAADKIITVSKLVKKQIVEKYGIPESKVTVVYNAIDLTHYRKENIERPLDEKIVLFVGRLTIQKGCEFFLEAAKKVLEVEPKTRFLVVGTGDLLHNMIQKSIDLGISGRVTFTGFEENVNAYYSISDLFVMPSVSEPFGLTAVEAMACQAPVLVSKQSGVSEILKNVLKVDFWDVDELANKMVAVLKYQSLLIELKQRGFHEIQDFRNWGNVAEETVSVYKEVLK